MRNDELPDIISQLIDGWNERIEYGIIVAGHTEKRVERRRQKPVIDQLVELQYHTPCQGNNGSGGGSNTNKPGSKTPGNLEQPDEILNRIHTTAIEILGAGVAPGQFPPPKFAQTSGGRIAPGQFSPPKFAQTSGGRIAPGQFPPPKFAQTFTTRKLLQNIANNITMTAEDRDHAQHELGTCLRQARLMLGYDSRTIAFQGTHCAECGGTLVIREDRPTQVWCAGTQAAAGCGLAYHWWEWPALVTNTRLVDTATAAAWTGRSPDLIRRWASDGRITNHGRSCGGKALWDLAELPKCIPGEKPPPPPQKIFPPKA